MALVSSSYTIININDGAAGPQGPTGPQGSAGTAGRGITTINIFYKATQTQSEPAASQITDPTKPVLSETNKYLWQKTVTNYSDSTSTTVVTLVGIYEVCKFLGVIKTTIPSVSGCNEGDYFVVGGTDISSAYKAGSVWVKKNGTWMTLSEADKLLVCLAALRNETNPAISLSSISNSEAVTWFNELIADKGIFDKLFTKEITMEGSGIIKSKNYAEDSSGAPTKGYKLIGEEDLIKAKGLRVVDLVASGDSVLMGSIVHPYLKTQKAVPSQGSISYTESVAYFNRKTLITDYTAKVKQYGSYEVFLGQHQAAGNTYKFYGYVFNGTVVHKGNTYQGIVIPIRDNYKEFTALLSDGYYEGSWYSHLSTGYSQVSTSYSNHLMIGNFTAEKMSDTYVQTSASGNAYSATFNGTTYTQNSYQQYYKPTQTMLNAFSAIPVGATSQVSSGTARIGSSTFSAPFYISKGSTSLMLYDGNKSINLEVDVSFYTQLLFSSIVLASGIDGIVVGNIEPDTSGRNIGNTTPFSVLKANTIYSNLVYGAVFN